MLFLTSILSGFLLAVFAAEPSDPSHYSLSDYGLAQSQEMSSRDSASSSSKEKSEMRREERRRIKEELKLHRQRVRESTRLESSLQVAEAVEKKGVKKYYAKREIGFARMKLNRPTLTYGEWQDLVASGDAQILAIKADFEEVMRKERKLNTAKKLLNRNPGSTEAIARMKALGRTYEEEERRKFVKENRKPMSKERMNAVNCSLSRLRREISNFMRDGRRRRAYVYSNEQEDTTAEASADPACAEGDACANRILKIITTFRDIFRVEPVSEQLIPLHQEIDNWMLQNLIRYHKIELPTSYPEFHEQTIPANAASGAESTHEDIGTSEKSISHSHYKPDILDPAELEEIIARYPSRKAFKHSLFHYDADPQSSSSDDGDILGITQGDAGHENDADVHDTDVHGMDQMQLY